MINKSACRVPAPRPPDATTSAAHRAGFVGTSSAALPPRLAASTPRVATGSTPLSSARTVAMSQQAESKSAKLRAPSRPPGHGAIVQPGLRGARGVGLPDRGLGHIGFGASRWKPDTPGQM